MYACNMVGAEVGTLDFDQVHTRCFTPRGGSFLKTIHVGMPRIPKNYLDSVFFLYRTIEDAEKRSDEGGTGFIVSMPTVSPDLSFVYFVTNWHVAVKRGFPVVRIETHSGDPDIFDFDCADWRFSKELDIAVVFVNLNPKVHDVVAVPAHSFMTKEYKEQHDIGPGEDVFMVGLFVDHKGFTRNVPALRFGNISMDPAPLTQGNGKVAESYCIDIHSRSGYSGSPVFVYRTPDYDLAEHLTDERPRLSGNGPNLLALLGIHWGQFPEMWELTSGSRLKEEDEGHSREVLMTGSRFVKGLSGMTCVLPAWYIDEVLNMPELRSQRDQENAEIRKMRGDIPMAEANTVEEDLPVDGDALLSRMLNTPPKPRQ